MAQTIRLNTNNTALVWSPATGSGYPFGYNSYVPSKELDTNGDGKFDSDDDPFAPYYPGDQFVDWVGLSSFFSGDSRIYPKQYRPQNQPFAQPGSPTRSAPTPTTTLQSGSTTDVPTIPFRYTQRIAVVPEFEAHLNNAGTPYNFYETFAARKKKPFILCSAGAAFLRGDAINPIPGEVQFKSSWFSQILDYDRLARYPLIRALVFFNTVMKITETTYNGPIALPPNTEVDYAFTKNFTVLESFRSKLADLTPENHPNSTTFINLVPANLAAVLSETIKNKTSLF
jgi:hypothetical protein